MKDSRARAKPPIINFGRFRIDWPSREHSLADNLKFAAFVALLLVIFALLSQCQSRWLMSQNIRSQTPAVTTTPPP
jgi:hypothetical protein